MKRCCGYCERRIWFWEARYWSRFALKWFHGECACIWLDYRCRIMAESITADGQACIQATTQQTAARARRSTQL